MPILVGVLVVLVLAVAGLAYALTSGSGAEPAASAPSSASKSTAAPTETPSPSTGQLAAGQIKLKLGQSHTFAADADRVTVTALDHRRYSGNEAIEVRTCNAGRSTFTASTIPWLLSYDRGEELIDVTVEGGGLMSPAFPERQLGPGNCAKGWISYEPPASGRPDGVEYRIEDAVSVRWEW